MKTFYFSLVTFTLNGVELIACFFYTCQIIDDALSLARGHQHNYLHALHTITYLRNETNYIPWLSAFNKFDFILGRFKNEEAPLFKVNFI